MRKYLSDSDINAIEDAFGEKYCQSVYKKLDKLSPIWHLSDFEVIPYFSANLLIKCKIKNQKKGVLKISARDHKNFNYEARALDAFNHPLFASMLQRDLSEQAILLESLEPGTPLRDLEDLNQRVNHFTRLYKDIHKSIIVGEGFLTYMDWVEKITKYMNENYKENSLTLEMNDAYNMIKNMWEHYPDKTLLHGDFHHDNILVGEKDAYRIIDPKGVIGPAIFDLPRFILNEFDDIYEEACINHIRKVIDLISQQLNISKTVLQKCLYIEACMAACWCVQDDPSLKDDLNLLKMVEMSKKIRPQT